MGYARPLPSDSGQSRSRADLGNTSYFDPPPPIFADRAGGVRLYDHIVRVGLNWQFWP